MIELRTVLVHVLRCFELGTSYAFHENARMSETILRPKLGVPVKLIRRH